MSRSTKKPYLQLQGHKHWKKICSRIERRGVRQVLKPWRYKWIECHGWGCEEQMITAYWRPWDDKEYEYGHCGLICNCYQFIAPMEPVLPIKRYETMSPYDICDYRCYRPQDPKSFRK